MASVWDVVAGDPLRDPLEGIDIEGPVSLEVFVLWLRDATIELTGPCGPEPWYIETTASQHPVEVVRRLATDAIGDPLLVHSTSWRQGEAGVILSFFVVIGADDVGDMASTPVERVDLARSSASDAPPAIAASQVLEHAIRHMAWLAKEDDVVRSTLTDEWHVALGRYVPEPFRNLA